MKFTIVKQLNNSFKVAYDSDYEKIKRIKVGDFLECEIRKPRNYQFHKKFFALIQMIYQNQEIYNNIDDLREDLTISAGYYVKRENLQGEAIKKAKSIKFSEMDEHEFSDYYSRVLDEIVKHFPEDQPEDPVCACGGGCNHADLVLHRIRAPRQPRPSRLPPVATCSGPTS